MNGTISSSRLSADQGSDSTMKRVQDKVVRGENRNNIQLQDNIIVLPIAFTQSQNRSAKSDRFAKNNFFGEFSLKTYHCLAYYLGID